MVRSILISFLAVSQMAAFRETGPVQERGSLAIVLDIRGQVSLVTVTDMQEELQRVLSVPGLGLQWRTLDESTSEEVFERLVVVRLKGVCSTTAPLPAVDNSPTLGFAHITDGEILPFAEIDCDRVRRLVNLHLTSTNPMRRETLLGRALARVMAHELYHILAATTAHTTFGVTKALLTPEDLVVGRLNLHESAITRIGRALFTRRAEPSLQAADGN